MQEKSEAVIPNEKFDIKIKSIRFKNFKVYEDYTFDFTDKDQIKNFICFTGPNGTGKTTLLDSIQMLFSRFNGRELDRVIALLGKSVRHANSSSLDGVYGNNNFLISAFIQSSLGDYEIKIDKTGFIQDHPEEIKPALYRICFFSKFDQELHKFQLAREKWILFKDLLESVTGFEVNESFNENKKTDEMMFALADSQNKQQEELIKKYVFKFEIKKPNEIIGCKECSDGERKIIKSFSTLLNKEYTPKIILIDNITMHVESGRHLNLIESIKRCFPESQIFSSAHSYHISKNFSDRNQIYDLRMVRSCDMIREQPWKMYLIDELKDTIFKIKSMSTIDEKIRREKLDFCNDLVNNMLLLDEKTAMEKTSDFLAEIQYLCVKDIQNFYKKI